RKRAAIVREGHFPGEGSLTERFARLPHDGDPGAGASNRGWGFVFRQSSDHLIGLHHASRICNIRLPPDRPSHDLTPPCRRHSTTLPPGPVLEHGTGGRNGSEATNDQRRGPGSRGLEGNGFGGSERA